MSADVVLLNGNRVATPGSPDDNVVAEMEHLLEAAKSGRLAGIAYSIIYSDDATNNRYVGVISRAQVGGLFAVMHRISTELDNA